VIAIAALAMAASVAAQNPPQAGAGTTPPQTPAAGQRGGGGRGRGVQTMTLTTTAWTDGGTMPAKYTQAGHDVSPPLAWTNVPDTATSFVLIAHDLDAPIGNGLDDVLHWMLWNVPGATRSLGEGVAQGPQLADGTRQISVTGPYYRGPAAPATGPVHHYVFEIYGLDVPTLDVAPVGAAPPATRAAVVAAMTGHIRGKASLVGLYRR
jgi:Raf kinase inhibitor-like YbhB/YbcL family protein